jgi:hypothetical protein
MTNQPNSIGINAQVGGVPKFVADMGQVQAALDKATQVLTKNTDALDKITNKVSDGTKKAAESTDKLGNSLQQASSRVIAFVSSLTGMSEKSIRASMAIGATGIAIDRVLESGIQGAKVTAVERGFERIVDAAQGSSSKLLSEMKTATNGMISDFELMQRTNIMLTGLYEDTGKSFVDHMGELLAITRAQAKLTGQDFNTVYTGMMDGLKRNEFHMLANIGISIRAEEVYARYAASVGKTASELNAAERQQAALNEVLRMGISLTQVAGAIQEDAADKYARMLATITNITNKMGQMFEPITRGVYDLANSILAPIKDLVDQIAPYIAAAFTYIGQAFTVVGNIISFVLKSLNIGQGIKNLFLGGVYLIGALAKGMVQALNEFIIPAVDAIAQAIASVLIGHSPPPEGPLHFIDVGGQKVLEAWLAGFMGVDLAPVDEVASYVQTVMGDIAFFSREQVAAEKKALDDVLNPYIDKLNILKASYDALKPSTDAAFSAIDRQLMVSVKALVKGDEQAAATTRYLDAAKDSLQGYIEKQEELIDQETLQVAIVQSQQAEERVLLAIRERQLGPEEKVTNEKEKQAKKEKEAGGAPIAATSAAFAGFGEGQPEKTDWEASLNKAMGEVGAAFKATGLTTELDKAKKNIEKIQGYFKPKEATKTMTDTIKEVYGSLKVEDIIGDSTDPNSPSGKMSNILLEAIKRWDSTKGAQQIKSALELSFGNLKTLGISDKELVAEITRVFGKAFTDVDVTKILAIAKENPQASVENIIASYVKDSSTVKIKAALEDKLGQSFGSIDANQIVKSYQAQGKLEATFDLLIYGYDEQTGAIKVSNLLRKTFGDALVAFDQERANITNIPIFGNMIASLSEQPLDKTETAVRADLEFLFGSVFGKVDIDNIISLAKENKGVAITDIINKYVESGKDTTAATKLIEDQISAAIGGIDASRINIGASREQVAKVLEGIFAAPSMSNETFGPPAPSSGGGTLNKVVSSKGAGGGFSGISSGIQAAIEASLSKDFKERFSHMVYTFVVVDMQGGFTKGLDQIFDTGGKDNVFSRLLAFKDNTQTMVLDVILAGVDTFISSTDTKLAQLPGMLVNSALNPMLTFFNAFKDNFVKGVNQIITGLNYLFDNLNNSFSKFGMGKLSNMGAMSVADFPLIGAAQGGFFNMLQVGERGPELMGPAQQIGVLPTALMTDIKAILSNVASVAAMPTYAGNHSNTYNNSNSTSYNNNMTNNFNGSSNPNNIAAKLHYLKALGLV